MNGMKVIGAVLAALFMVSCEPDDQAVQQHVTEVLNASPGVSASVQGGVVTLNGTVTDTIIASAAAEAAGKVKGVRRIDNKIVFKPDTPKL